MFRAGKTQNETITNIKATLQSSFCRKPLDTKDIMTAMAARQWLGVRKLVKA